MTETQTKRAGWPSDLNQSAARYPLRITKTVRLWLLDNGCAEFQQLLARAPHRSDEAAQVILTAEQLRKLWWHMDTMLDQMLERRYTPGCNAAVGMQRKAEAFIPTLPW